MNVGVINLLSKTDEAEDFLKGPGEPAVMQVTSKILVSFGRRKKLSL